jgi:caffeoyl-CoA O-methyltransferase
MSRTATTLRPVTPIGILASSLAELCARAEADPAHESLLAELLAARDLATGLEPYLERCTTPESAALADLAERTRTLDWASAAAPQDLEAEMLSGQVEGQLLQLLVRATHAVRVLELGMFTGYSALAMAEGLPAHGRLVACEIDAGVAAFASHCFAASSHGHKIDIRVGPARRTLRQLGDAGEQFDLVFIDADKPGYVDYYQAVVGSGLLSPDGLLCVDNTLMQGQAYAPEPPGLGATIHDFNETVRADPRVRQVLLPLRDGLTLVQRSDTTTGA